MDPLLCKLPLYQSISFILSTFHEMWMISPYLQQVLDSLPDSAQSKHELPHMDNKLSGVSSGRSCISNLWFCYQAANVSSQRLHDHVRRRCSICRQCRKMNLKKKIYKFWVSTRGIYTLNAAFVYFLWEGTFKGKERNLNISETLNRHAEILLIIPETVHELRISLNRTPKAGKIYSVVRVI